MLIRVEKYFHLKFNDHWVIRNIQKLLSFQELSLQTSTCSWNVFQTIEPLWISLDPQALRDSQFVIFVLSLQVSYANDRNGNISKKYLEKSASSLTHVTARNEEYFEANQLARATKKSSKTTRRKKQQVCKNWMKSSNRRSSSVITYQFKFTCDLKIMA